MENKKDANPFEKKFIGNPVPIGTSRDRYDGFLMEGEEVRREFKGLRDAMLFTDLRLVVIDPQGIRGKKVSIASIPWKSITAFSVENSGTFDLEAELKVCGSGFWDLRGRIHQGYECESRKRVHQRQSLRRRNHRFDRTMNPSEQATFTVVLNKCPSGFFKQSNVSAILVKFAGESKKEAMESVKHMPHRVKRSFSKDEAQVLREQLVSLGVEVEITQST